MAPEGGVWGIVDTDNEAALLEHRMGELEQTLRPVLLRRGAEPDVKVDFVVGRDLFTRAAASDRAALARTLLGYLAEGGALSLAQVIPALGQRLSAFAARLPAALVKKIATAEEAVYTDPASDLVSWKETELADAFRDAGAREVAVEIQQFTDARRISERELLGWLAPGSPYGRALAASLTPSELDQAAEAWKGALVGRETAWTSTVAFLVARR
jgi:hypothetical protein